MPAGDLPPTQPIWCQPHPLADGPSTYSKQAEDTGAWLDDFSHNLTANALGDGYFTYEHLSTTFKSEHFRSDHHWLLDVAGHDQSGPNGPYYNFRGATMRPDIPFHFVGGKLVVEADVAASMDDYGAEA